MTKRTWIKIHNGLTSDPQHRARLGVRVWLFMWLIDQVDWESGIVWDYTDKRASEAMSDDDNKISPRTIEDQRQQLEKDGYITCHPSFQCQHIRIMRWRNPREVSPDQVNVPGNRETWYDLSRRHSTGTSVPIPAESSVPLHIDHTKDHTGIQALWEDITKQPAPGAILLEQIAFLKDEYGLPELKAALETATERRNSGAIRSVNVPYVRGILRNGGTPAKSAPTADPYLAKKEVSRGA